MNRTVRIFFKQIFCNRPEGNILLFVMVFGALSFSVIVGAIASYGIVENQAARHTYNREQAFQVAEAGVNYYRWHLAHNKNDYQDGTGLPGPYVHSYQDKDGKVIGYYSLEIIPPLSGSTVVTIKSTGWLDAQPSSKRVVQARVGFPALTDYALLADTDVWIGDSEFTNGKFHANGGIRFDGTGNAPITSALPTYTCKPYHGCNNVTKPGVWGMGGSTAYWQYPVPAKDFNAVTAKLAEIKTGAQNGGLYLSSSGKQGWRLEFRSDGTIRAYKVNTTNCYKGLDVNATTYVWYCIDIKTLANYISYPMPTNGYIYVDDMVWVDGTVKGRATVGTGAGKSIIFNDDVVYLAKDGTNVLGLIAEQNILIPFNAPTDLEIDAAMLAQKGATKRYYYSNNVKGDLITYGSTISAGLWTWSWVSGGGTVVSGYQTTNSTYDVNLTYNPPPGFPVGSEHQLISWEEL